MISRYEAYMNGVALSSISGDILVLDIAYTPPKPKDETFTFAKRDGGVIYNRYYDKYVVSISFEIHAYDVEQRQKICEAVCRWARDGGDLETNDRPGRKLHCVCSSYPSITSAKKWTGELKVEFTAYTLPFFEETVATRVQGEDETDDIQEVYVPGNVRGALVGCIVYANAPVTRIRFYVNHREIDLNDISLASGDGVAITYDDELIQSINKIVGGQLSDSLMSYRKGVDDLTVNCGEINRFRIKSSASVNYDFAVKGLWL